MTGVKHTLAVRSSVLSSGRYDAATYIIRIMGPARDHTSDCANIMSRLALGERTALDERIALAREQRGPTKEWSVRERVVSQRKSGQQVLCNVCVLARGHKQALVSDLNYVQWLPL